MTNYKFAFDDKTYELREIDNSYMDSVMVCESCGDYTIALELYDV